jgi:hypothetical protein
VREFAFELALCAHLEAATDWVVGRQLGGAVADPGARVIDVVGIAPGPVFDERTAITDGTIPPRAVESGVGVGRAVPVGDVADSEWDREWVQAAVETGFFEREYDGGRECVRRATRYPDGWFDRLVAVENKPDLARPGGLERQVRLDVALGLFDEVVVATASYVTRAHLNRLPEAVGVWRFDPGSGDREVVREPTHLDVEGHGVEPTDERPLATDIAFASPAQKRRARRRIAERAYGKGWRNYRLPACEHARVLDDGRPYCAAYDRVVDPRRECGADCPDHAPGDPPPVDRAALRAARTPWVPDPDGVARRQSGLDRFG